MANDSYEEKSDAANKNLLKQDIAIRIAEAANDAKYLYKALMTNPGSESTYKYLYDFIGSFFSLYDQTVDNLNAEYRELAEDGGTMPDDEDREVPSVEEYFSQPLISMQNDDGEEVVDVQRSAMQALQMYRMYKQYLRESDLMKLKRYAYKRQTYGGRDGG